MENNESEKEVLEKRKLQIANFFKKSSWIYYIILLGIISFAVWIRTLNISKLKDITTGTWTLGPDLDPFLFLRWAKYIVAHGSLFAVDTMRNVPLGFKTAAEMKLLPYMIAWFHNFLSLFIPNLDVTYSAILFPVVAFVLTTIAFFLFAREIFHDEKKHLKNIIALLATLIFVLVPSLLPRTIAGIPEKESIAFAFMFFTFYFILKSFRSEKTWKGILFGCLAGLSTALMALIWGGVIFVFFAIPMAVILAFILGKIDRKKIYFYASWILISFAFMIPFSTKYSVMSLLTSTSTGFAVGVLFLIIVSKLIRKIKFIEKIGEKTKLPKEIFSLILAAILLIILVVAVLGFGDIIHVATDVKNSLVQPITTRFGLTVAENQQPYFASDWVGSFGPVALGIPIFFWLFFIGSVYLFYTLISSLHKKEKILLTISYIVYIAGMIFSKYSEKSILNGDNFISILVYFGGVLFFVASAIYVYYKRYKLKEEKIFKYFNFNYMIYFVILTIGIIAARSGIRLIMVLGAISPVVIAFLVVKVTEKTLKEKNDNKKMLIGIIALLLIIATIFTIYVYYNQEKVSAENFVPGPSQWQWQEAMKWVRDSTPTTAVFAHWWDYGYWVQSIGERATVLDGGNAIVYWDYLMGRLVLTGTSEKDSLEFLYTHNATHLLIDSTDIGKYPAFSSIGSDVNYDRLAQISTFLVNDQQTQETQTETTYVYSGGAPIEDDTTWNNNGTEITFLKENSGVGAIILKKDVTGLISQPQAVIISNGKQYFVPLRYAFVNGELHDFGTGINSGVFIYPELVDSPTGQVSINPIGAMFYLDSRTINSEIAKLYLFDEQSSAFKLAHIESSYITSALRNQGADAGEFIYYHGFQGPIKIWEINYPAGTKSNPDYLQTKFPDKNLNLAKPGYY